MLGTLFLDVLRYLKRFIIRGSNPEFFKANRGCVLGENTGNLIIIIIYLRSARGFSVFLI